MQLCWHVQEYHPTRLTLLCQGQVIGYGDTMRYKPCCTSLFAIVCGYDS